MVVPWILYIYSDSFHLLSPGVWFKSFAVYGIISHPLRKWQTYRLRTCKPSKPSVQRSRERGGIISRGNSNIFPRCFIFSMTGMSVINFPGFPGCVGLQPLIHKQFGARKHVYLAQLLCRKSLSHARVLKWRITLHYPKHTSCSLSFTFYTWRKLISLEETHTDTQEVEYEKAFNSCSTTL